MKQIRYFLDNNQEMDSGTIETENGPIEISWTPEQMQKRTEAAAYLETSCPEVSEGLRSVILEIIWIRLISEKERGFL